MNGEKLVSIIVPIYNVEKYLDECVQSLVTQTYHNLEILLIDDGSKDESGRIADLWANRDGRIRVFHQENGGVSKARNYGLENVKGEYIFFVDSDDYVAKNYIEELVKGMEKDNAELAMCNFFAVWKDMTALAEHLPDRDIVMSCGQFLEGLYTYSGHYSMMWNKGYRRELFDGVIFEEGKVNEDARIIRKFIPKIKNVTYISQGLYFYRQTQGSIMRGGDKERLLQSELEWIREHLELLYQREEENVCMLALKLYFNKIIEYYPCLKKETQKVMREELKKVGKELLFYKKSLGRVIYKIYFGMYFPGLTAMYQYKRISQAHVYFG